MWEAAGVSEFAGGAEADGDVDERSGWKARGMEATTRSLERGRDNVVGVCWDAVLVVLGGDWSMRSEEHSSAGVEVNVFNAGWAGDREDGGSERS